MRNEEFKKKVLCNEFRVLSWRGPGLFGSLGLSRLFR